MRWARCKRTLCGRAATAVASETVEFSCRVIAQTVRAGRAIDEIEIAVPGNVPTTAYLLGHDGDRPREAVMAFHDEWGDKATLLDDLKPLADQGVLGLSVDSATTRTAMADRDPRAAFDAQLAIAQAALRVLQSTEGVLSHGIGVIGWGIGGEVGARLAGRSGGIQVVVTVGSLPRRSQFIDRGEHALAAGIRSRRGDAATDAMATSN